MQLISYLVRYCDIQRQQYGEEPCISYLPCTYILSAGVILYMRKRSTTATSAGNFAKTIPA
jgi:hypothetical protein